MRVALLHNHYDESHLADVVAEMQTLGAPAIHAVWMDCYGHWVALEGCHRLRAAARLSLTPEIIEVEYSDDTFETDDEEYVISEVCDASYDAEIIEF